MEMIKMKLSKEVFLIVTIFRHAIQSDTGKEFAIQDYSLHKFKDKGLLQDGLGVRDTNR